MKSLVTLQLHADVVADLLEGLQQTIESCIATREYLESGLCCSDVMCLPIESSEEADWLLDFCKITHRSIIAQLERQGAVDLICRASAILSD